MEMNTGLVSSRYAKALLKFAMENGTEKQVYAQVMTLHERLSSLPQLRELIDYPKHLPDSSKLELLESALGEEKMAPELHRFICLVMKNHRTRLLRLMFVSFIFQYREAHGIKLSKLVTAVPDTELERKLERIIKERKGDSVLFEHRIDPDILGGFIFEIDGYRLDASTASQLKSVRRQFIEKNRRIV